MRTVISPLSTSLRPGLCRPAAGRTRTAPRLTALVALVAALALGTPAVQAQGANPGIRAEPSAAAPRPMDLVKTTVTRVLAVVQSQPTGAALTANGRREIRRAAEDLFDFDEMARRTLAQHWKERSPQEQAQFARMFVDVLEHSYLTTISNFPVAAITYQDESITGAYAQVRSRIVTDRRAEIPLEYRLLLTDGRWQAYDVVANGVSLISSYRSQFNSIIRTSSFAHLLERLRAREVQATPRQGP